MEKNCKNSVINFHEDVVFLAEADVHVLFKDRNPKINAQSTNIM